MPIDERKRQISGTNVYIVGGVEGGKIKVGGLLGKIRLVTKRGTEITETVNDSIKATLQKTLNVVGKFILSDEDGVELPLIETLKNNLGIKKPVKIVLRTVSCPKVPVAPIGIVTGVYTAVDCMGNPTEIKVPKSGVIQSATWWDMDDEGLQTDVLLFNEKITQIGDHNKFSPAGLDMLFFITEIAFFSFDDHDTMQTSEVNNIGKAYTAPHGKLWFQARDPGTQNIATGYEPRFQLQILSDDPTWRG